MTRAEALAEARRIEDALHKMAWDMADPPTWPEYHSARLAHLYAQGLRLSLEIELAADRREADK